MIDTGLGMNFFGFDEGLYLTSDRAMATWWDWTDTAFLREKPSLMNRILAANLVLDNMGGILMWPGRQVGGQTLNQARRFGQKATIADRLDLTVECIRRAYGGVLDSTQNPLGPTLQRYWPFFELFANFAGYVEFWLLEDLLDEDGKRVRNLMGGVLEDYDFASRSPLPSAVDAYDEYLNNAQHFVLQRNRRMATHWLTL